MANAHDLLTQIFANKDEEVTLAAELQEAQSEDTSSAASLASVLDTTQTYVYLKADGSAVIVTFETNSESVVAPVFADAIVIAAPVVVVEPVAVPANTDATTAEVAPEAAAQ